MAAALVGCDTVGAALVDDKSGPEPEDVLRIPCGEPPPCDNELAAIVDVPARGLAAVDFEQCRINRVGPCVNIDAGAASDAGVAEDASLDLEALVAEGCGRRTPTYEEALDGGIPCGPDPTRECETVTIEAEAEAGWQQLDQIAWFGTEVLVEADQPLKLELTQPWLFDVSITLRGPITLRLIDSKLVRNLRLRTIDTDATAVELEEVIGEHVLIGEPTSGLGRIDITRSELTDVQLVAAQQRWESTLLKSGLAEAGDLLGLDVDLSDIELGVDRTLLSAFQLRRSQFTRCDALTLIEGTAFETQLVPCDASPARLYSVYMVGGAFDGTAESDRSAWLATVLGAQHDSELTAWGSSFTSVTLCTSLNKFALAAGSDIRCSSCPDGTPDAPDVSPGGPAIGACFAPRDVTGGQPRLCHVPSKADRPDAGPIGNNYCELPTEVPLCEQPHPDRQRPLPPPF